MIGNWSIGINLYAWIRFNLPRKSTILQLGSGQIDDLLLCDYNLISIEHDTRYLKSHCIHAPLKNGWYDIQSVPGYDLLIVDGPPNKYRSGIIDRLDLFAVFQTVIVDDVNRRADMRVALEISAWSGRKIVVHDDNEKKFATI